MRHYSQRDEMAFSRKLHSSAMSYSASSVLIDFPSTPSGLRILDIGSGESDCISQLSRFGAYVFGLDVRYRDLASLKTQTDRTVLDTSSNVTARYGSGMAAKFRQDTELNRQNFWAYLAKDKKLVSALAGSLPFEPETFDFVYSINCLMKGLDEDEAIFRQAVSEAFRVLKRGCDLQLWPYLGNNVSRNGKNQRRVLKEYDHTVERINTPIDHPLRVRIKKS